MFHIVEIMLTPNPESLKYILHQEILKGTEFGDFHNSASAKRYSPLAAELLQFPFIQSVFFAHNFITITKNPTLSWQLIKHELSNYIEAFISEGKPLITEIPPPKKEHMGIGFSLFPSKKEVKTFAESLLDTPITVLLEEQIAPSVKQDGGKIEYRGFENGIVYVKMSGACMGCPGATATLKLGIEALLKKHFQEVQEVRSIEA
jgi:Fe-S cluster biogenesis protein NfuA